MSVNIHASVVVLDDAGSAFGAPPEAGILLLGESGAGKSDLVLQLIERGAKLVADDRAELFVENSAMMARAPVSLAGLVEVRGLGVIALPCVAKARIALAVELVKAQSMLRMPEHALYMPPPELSLPDNARPPLVHLSAFEASARAKIALAAAAFAKALFRENRNP